MTDRNERILEIRGRERLEEGVRHLRVVATGGREGALPKYKNRALELLTLNETLTETRLRKVRNWLATGKTKTIEDALTRMETLIEKERRRKRQ